MRLTGSDSEIYSSSIESYRNGTEVPLEWDQIPVQKAISGDRRLDVGDRRGSKYAQIEVVDGDGEENSRVDMTRLEPHVEPLQCQLGRKLWLDGVADSLIVDVLLGSGSGVT